MPQVSSKKLLTSVGGCDGDLETTRVHWKKGFNPSGLNAGDWLLIPLNASDLIHGDHPLLRQPVAELASVFKALAALRSWLKEQRTPFSLESAAANCFKVAWANLTSDIQEGIRLILEDLGCTRFEKNTSASGCWYMPPLPPAVRKNTARDPPGKGMESAEGCPVAPSYEIYRMGAVIKLTGLSRSSIYRLEAASSDLFPKRVKLGASAVGWRSDEIHSWIGSRKVALAKGKK